MSNKFILSVMGETEIERFEVDISKKREAIAVPSLPEDHINLLGAMLDNFAEKDLTETQQAEMAYIAESFVLSKLNNEIHGYVLLLVLREKWPVGQKAKFKVTADRVSANHTYLSHICAPQTIVPSPDETQLKKAEDNALITELAFLKKNKKRFANSSAVQSFLRQKG